MRLPTDPRDPKFGQRLLFCGIVWTVGWGLHIIAVYALDPSRHRLPPVPGLILMVGGAVLHVVASATVVGYTILNAIGSQRYIQTLRDWARAQDAPTLAGLASDASSRLVALSARAELRRRERERAA